MPGRPAPRGLRWRAPLALLAAALLAAPTASAQSAGAGRVLEDFTADKTVTLCAHEIEDLRAAQESSGGQETPGFLGAVEAVIAAQERGECAAPATGEPTPAPGAPAPAAEPGAGTGAGTGAAAPGSPPGDGIPAASWALGAAALALALLGLLSWLVSGGRRGTERFAAMGHAWREAGHRTRSAWLDFADWLRLGR